MNRFAGLFLAFAVSLAVIPTPAVAQDKTLTVFAAASMKNALDEVDTAYTAKTGIKITVSYAASSALAKQIEQGAPADMFISADTDWMDYAIGKKTINEPTRVNLLGNSIVLIAPKDSKVDNVNIGAGFDLAKLAGDGKIATGDVKSVPVGKYAKAALEKLGSWQAAEPKFAMAESVRAALTLVARGEAVLGHRLFDRRQGRARRQGRRHLPGRFPSGDHLSGGGDDHREAGDDGLSRLPALDCGEDHPREIRLQVSRQPFHLMFDISPAEWTAILLSLRVAVVATLVATPFGIALAWLLARREFWGKSILDAAVHLPLVLPPVVTGYLLLLTFGRRGLVGAWLADHLGIVFAFRWTGAALACGIMSFPLLVRPIRLSIEAIDRRLEQASSTLGAAPWQVFATVTLPLALPGVLAGMVLGFAKAIGEFGATITFVSNIPGETQTISSAIYSLIQTPDGDAAAGRLVLISIVIAMGALIASEWFARRATKRLHGN